MSKLSSVRSVEDVVLVAAGQAGALTVLGAFDLSRQGVHHVVRGAAIGRGRDQPIAPDFDSLEMGVGEGVFHGIDVAGIGAQDVEAGEEGHDHHFESDLGRLIRRRLDLRGRGSRQVPEDGALGGLRSQGAVQPANAEAAPFRRGIVEQHDDGAESHWTPAGPAMESTSQSSPRAWARTQSSRAQVIRFRV